MAQRHHDTALAGPLAGPAGTPAAGDVLTGYLREQATAFLRALNEEGDDATGRQLRRAARRIGGALHTYGPLADPAWAEPLRAELGWLTTTLGREHQHAARLARLVSALHRLAASEEPGDGALAIGAARAGALLERRLTLARTRAHSAALQAMGSSRFHAVADAVAVMASDVPLAPAARAPAPEVLPALTGQAHARLADAAEALPLTRAAQPYNGGPLCAALAAEPPADRQDAPWHRVRTLLRLSRYAREVCPHDDGEPEARPSALARILQQHHEAAEAAAAVTAAAQTPRIAPATAYALGVLHADQRQETEQARFAFAHLWLGTGSA